MKLIDRKVFISMLFLVLSMLGYVSYERLAMELMPNAEYPMLYISVTSESEVDPSYMESQAIIPLEGAVGMLEGVETITSNAASTSGTVMIEFLPGVDIKYAYLKLEEKVKEVKSGLPETFRTQVSKVDISSMSNQFMELQVLGDGGVDRVRTLAEQEIIPDLENIDGVANVKIYGGREKSIEIIIDEDACESAGITTGTIRQAISNNYNSRAFAGNVKERNEQLFVHVTAEYSSVSQLENLVIGNNNTLLKDVAQVYFGVKEETSYSRVNGKDAVSVILTNESQANLIDLSHKTHEIIDKMNAKLEGEGLTIDIQSDTAEDMETNINQIMELALIGALLAIVVLWIFLRKFRLISVIALAIPISVLTAYNFFYAYDISINSLTLIGMALAVGMLLDNAVVVLENIYRLRGKGMPVRDAVLQGTGEVWRSVFAATLTTIAVFLPFAFAEDFMVKLIGRQIGVSIISTLLVSLAVALLLIPMCVNAFMKRKSEGVTFYRRISTDNPLVQGYVILLKSSMRAPLKTILGAVITFFITVAMVLVASTGSLKEVDADSFKIYVTMDSGSTLDATDELVAEVEEKLGEFTYFDGIVSRIEEEEAILTVTMLETFEDSIEGNIGTVKQKVRNKLRNIRKAEISVDEEPTSSASYGGGGRTGGGGSGGGGSQRMMRMMGVGTSSESIVIRGDDFESMRNVADDLQYFLDDMESVSRASVSVSSDQPEMHLILNPLLMEEFSITQNEIATELNSFSNQINTNVPFKQGLEEYDILITQEEEIVDGEVVEESDLTLAELKKLEINTTGEGTMELQNVSRFLYASGMRRITRVNQGKEIEVTYSFEEEANESDELLQTYRAEVDELVNAYPLPSGVAVQVIHEEDDLGEFVFLFLAALLLIYMILASVFESLSTPFVLMFTIPLAAIGSFFALSISGNGLQNTNTYMGFLILLGIVVNNGIILIDYSNILMKRGYRRTRALINAGLSRVRPILITVITTIVAMVPLALGDEEYVGAIGAPFAITVIGGLVVSTVLTLIFIPTFYFGLENALAWIKGLSWPVKIVQAVLLALGFAAVYFYVESALWQSIDVIALVVFIPGVSWFVMNSLRKANEEIIDPNEPIRIDLQNLVKIYDRPSRFSREWNGNKHLREIRGVAKKYFTIRDFEDFVWQVPLLGFLVYFTFSYLESGFWQFLSTVTCYFYILMLLKPIVVWSKNSADASGKDGVYRLASKGKTAFLFVFPLACLAYFHFQWDNVPGELILLAVWYLALAIHFTSEKMYRENINVERLTGRFAKLRRLFYLFVRAIPVIGKKRKPFKALQGVSLEITTGMFGLLGPNGAGKSTMMRIICGIYEQSYGKVWINGIDTQEKREELQGLIGYLPQEFGTYENMSAIQFLDYLAILKGLSNVEERQQRLEYVLNAVHLWDRKDEDIGGFSGGMKQRIGIALTLLHLPRILVVDEPTAGLDPRERIRFRNLLVELSKERIVIFSTHVIEDIASSCNQVGVINRGQLRYHGHPNKMIHLAEGLVWQYRIPANEFDAMEHKDRVVHHMREDDEIVIRFLSETPPTPTAVQVEPVLEEAYLCLLKGMKSKVNTEAVVE